MHAAIKDGVTEKELSLARNKVTSSLILSDERPGNRMFALGQSWLSRRNYEPLEVVLSRYSDVTLDDIQRVATTTLNQTPVCVAVKNPAE